jgi:glycerol kinase
MMINTEIETLAASVPDNGGVYFVPALTGLGAPHWDQYARGAIWDYKRNDQRSYSTCDPRGIAYQVYDLAKSMEADFGEKERIKSRWRSSSK